MLIWKFRLTFGFKVPPNLLFHVFQCCVRSCVRTSNYNGLSNLDRKVPWNLRRHKSLLDSEFEVSLTYVFQVFLHCYVNMLWKISNLKFKVKLRLRSFCSTSIRKFQMLCAMLKYGLHLDFRVPLKSWCLSSLLSFEL